LWPSAQDGGVSEEQWQLFIETLSLYGPEVNRQRMPTVAVVKSWLTSEQTPLDMGAFALATADEARDRMRYNAPGKTWRGTPASGM
jgi:hypothetical protein